MIYHIATSADWRAAQAAGSYTADSLASQGFIHCSTREQVLGVANAIFRGQPGLLLLCIDEARLSAPVRYENLEGGQQHFPHIYGPLELQAVTRAVDFPPEPDGSFRLPPVS